MLILNNRNVYKGYNLYKVYKKSLMKKMAETSIGCSFRFKKFLKSKGNFGETYEQIIWRLLIGQPFTKKEVEEIKSEWEVKV